MGSVAEFAFKLDQFAQREPAIILQVLKEEGDKAATAMRKYFVPYPTAQGTDLLNIRRGRMLGAIGAEVTRGRDYTRLEVGVIDSDPTLQRAAHTQENGRTIRAKNPSGVMTIPLRDAMNANGVRRWQTLAEARQEFVIFRRGDFLYGHDKSNPKGGLKKLYELREEVTIPSRSFVKPQAQPLFDRVAERLGWLMAGALE